jgi:hypothetical protein
MSMWNVWPNWLFLLFSFLYVAYICLCEMWPNWLFLLFSFQYVAYICLCEMWPNWLFLLFSFLYVAYICLCEMYDQIDCSFYLAFCMWLINVYVKCMTKLIVPSIQLSVCGLYWNWLTCLYFLHTKFNCVRQLHPPFKMAAVTKNRNFFNCPLLLYYKSKWAQIVTAAT